MASDDLVFTPAEIARFWSKVDRSDPAGCWTWQGWRNRTGHGRFDLGYRKYVATQVAMILSGFPRPPAPRDNVLHGDTCSSAACCNPSHLRWGTKAENTQDRDRLGRRLPPTGERNGNAKLDAEKVRYIRSSPLNQYELARELGVSQVSVGNVRRGKTWAHVT